MPWIYGGVTGGFLQFPDGVCRARLRPDNRERGSETLTTMTVEAARADYVAHHRWCTVARRAWSCQLTSHPRTTPFMYCPRAVASLPRFVRKPRQAHQHTPCWPPAAKLGRRTRVWSFLPFAALSLVPFLIATLVHRRAASSSCSCSAWAATSSASASCSLACARGCARPTAPGQRQSEGGTRLVQAVEAHSPMAPCCRMNREPRKVKLRALDHSICATTATGCPVCLPDDVVLSTTSRAHPHRSDARARAPPQPLARPPARGVALVAKHCSSCSALCAGRPAASGLAS